MPSLSLIESVTEAFHDRCLLRPRQRVLIAASGGVDSMVLLEVLSEILPTLRCTFALAHFNHRLRGRASDADERLVRAAAQRHRVPFFRDDGDVRGWAKSQGVSIEMAARELRQAFLARVAKTQRMHCVAMGHHADDQAELFLMRACRGSGGDGLSGMSFTDPFPGVRPLRIIRPLLATTKSEIQGWASSSQVTFREDASNQKRDCQRNIVRQEIVPLLRRDWGEGVVRAIGRSMEIVGAESRFIEAYAKSWVEGQVPLTWDALDPAVQRQVLRVQLLALGVDGGFELIELLRRSPGKAVAVGKPGSTPVAFVVRDWQGRIHPKQAVEENPEAQKPILLDLTARSGRLRLGGKALRWRIQQAAPPGWPSKRSSGVEVFDAEKVGSSVVLRHWSEGDRYRPLGLSGTAKLQDLFTNAKIPRSDRSSLWVACVGSGKIFWVEGLRPSEDFKVSDQTRRWLVWALRIRGS